MQECCPPTGSWGGSESTVFAADVPAPEPTGSTESREGTLTSPVDPIPWWARTRGRVRRYYLANALGNFVLYSLMALRKARR